MTKSQPDKKLWKGQLSEKAKSILESLQQKVSALSQPKTINTPSQPDQVPTSTESTHQKPPQK